MVLAAVGLLAGPARAQKATEMLIPIGQSPGLSGISSVIGTIVSCDAATGVVTIAGDKEQHTATVTKETKIWLDRSVTRRGGVLGSLSDCQKGRRSEVKYLYEGKTRTALAEWIKIQIE
jgi:hypothetical protein